MKQTLKQSFAKTLRFGCLVGITALLVAMPAMAQEDEHSLAEKMRSCASISNAIERLVCFDDLVVALPAANEAQDARDTARTRATERAEANARATAALEQRQRNEELSGRERAAQARIEAAERRAAEAEARLAQERAEQQRAEEAAALSAPPSDKTYITVVEAWQSPRGLWRFRLDNGQEWHQSSSEGGVRYQEGERYYIEPGRFGSYFLGTDDNNRRMRIRMVE